MLFRVPVHRPQRHRHLAGLLAHDGLHDGLRQAQGQDRRCDELDIIEAYGGEGPGSPNADDTYMITPHCWNQGEAGKAIETDGVRGDAQSDPHAQVRHPLHLVRDVPHLRLQDHRDRHDLLLRQHRGGPPRHASALQGNSRSSSWSIWPPAAAGPLTCPGMTAWPTCTSITCACTSRVVDQAQ